jgi:transposase
VRNELIISETLNAKGRFILATNDLDEKAYPDEAVLAEYKDQYKVENQGFRFLKDPWFMADDIYLKSAKRIEALMVVMTLCLFIYNYGQYIARQRLKEQNQTVPSQVKKPTQKPTMRWLFQCMSGALVIYGLIDGKMRKLVLNITALRQKIIQLFGDVACQMYGVVPKAA